jgi:hypothetical protein
MHKHSDLEGFEGFRDASYKNGCDVGKIGLHASLNI